MNDSACSACTPGVIFKSDFNVTKHIGKISQISYTIIAASFVKASTRLYINIIHDIVKKLHNLRDLFINHVRSTSVKNGTSHNITSFIVTHIYRPPNVKQNSPTKYQKKCRAGKLVTFGSIQIKLSAPDIYSL